MDLDLQKILTIAAAIVGVLVVARVALWVVKKMIWTMIITIGALLASGAYIYFKFFAGNF